MLDPRTVLCGSELSNKAVKIRSIKNIKKK